MKTAEIQWCMNKLILILCSLFIFLYFVMKKTLNYFESVYLYYPTPSTSWIQQHAAENKIILPSGSILYEFPSTSKHNDNKKGNLLFCHGNGGNVLSCIDIIHALVDKGWNVYALEYRGYGELYTEEQTVKTTEIEQDVKEAVLYKKWDCCLGFSLGGILLVHTLGKLSVQFNTKKLVLLNSMFDFQEVAKHHTVNYLGPLIKCISSIQWNAQNLLGKITNNKKDQLLVIHSLEDEVVPCEQAKQYELKGCNVIYLPEGSHCESPLKYVDKWIDLV